MSGRFCDPCQAGSQSISDRCITIIIIGIQFYKFQVSSVFSLRLCYIIINTLYRFCIIACSLSWQNISKRDISPYNKYVDIIVCIYSMATSVITHFDPFFSAGVFSHIYMFGKKGLRSTCSIKPCNVALGIRTCFNIEICTVYSPVNNPVL